jgi:vacuolar-type H+-ATPase subunit F/Vma7
MARTSERVEPESGTRMIALGSAALTDGFRLIGFETIPDATRDELEELLKGMVRNREKALVVIEHELARSGCPTLDHIRHEGGRIVVAEVPPLHAPGDYHPQVETIVRSVLGPGALEW